MHPAPVAQLSLRVSAAEGDVPDPRAFEELTDDLRAALAGVDVRRIERVSAGAPPEGARSIEVLSVCTFVITVVQTAEALAKVVQAVRLCLARYAERRPAARVTLAGMDVGSASDAELAPIVTALLALPARPLTGVRRALIVANTHYDDPALAQLRAPNHDADALARVLGAPSIGGFDVELLTDADERAIRRRIAAFFAGRDRDDLLLLHFSGHGVKDAHGRLYLAARDTELSTLSATAVPASFVNDQLAETHSRRVVLILDCCYSGAFARNTVARAGNTVHLTEEFGGGAGRVVLTASSATEYAFEDGALTRDEGRPSVFTTALVNGLATGEADLDADGEISIDELYTYTHRQVREHAPGQTPQKWSFGIEGNLTIARSPRPAALPAAILDDLASDRVPLRLAAIAALAQLARTGRPGQQATAVSALVQLRDHDDSFRVRAAAADALTRHTDVPAPSSVPAPAVPAPPSPPVARPHPAPPVESTHAPPEMASRQPGLALARLSLIFAIASLPTMLWGIGVVFAVVALVLAGNAVNRMRGTTGASDGLRQIVWAKRLAWTAIVLAVVLVIVLALKGV